MKRTPSSALLPGFQTEHVDSMTSRLWAKKPAARTRKASATTESSALEEPLAMDNFGGFGDDDEGMAAPLTNDKFVVRTDFHGNFTTNDR